MIYADGDCPEDGPGTWVNIPGRFPSIASPTVDWTDRAQVREVYLDHWRYNREDVSCGASSRTLRCTRSGTTTR